MLVSRRVVSKDGRVCVAAFPIPFRLPKNSWGSVSVGVLKRPRTTGYSRQTRNFQGPIWKPGLEGYESHSKAWICRRPLLDGTSSTKFPQKKAFSPGDVLVFSVSFHYLTHIYFPDYPIWVEPNLFLDFLQHRGPPVRLEKFQHRHGSIFSRNGIKSEADER